MKLGLQARFLNLQCLGPPVGGGGGGRGDLGLRLRVGQTIIPVDGFWAQRFRAEAPSDLVLCCSERRLSRDDAFWVLSLKG